MRVVLDTNVLLGALLSPHGWPDIIYRAWQIGSFRSGDVGRANRQCAARAAVTRSSGCAPAAPCRHDGQQHAGLVHAGCVTASAAGHRGQHPNDAFLLAMAQAGEADYLRDRRSPRWTGATVAATGVRASSRRTFCATAL